MNKYLILPCIFIDFFNEYGEIYNQVKYARIDYFYLIKYDSLKKVTSLTNCPKVQNDHFKYVKMVDNTYDVVNGSVLAWHRRFFIDDEIVSVNNKQYYTKHHLLDEGIISRDTKGNLNVKLNYVYEYTDPDNILNKFDGLFLSMFGDTTRSYKYPLKIVVLDKFKINTFEAADDESAELVFEADDKYSE